MEPLEWLPLKGKKQKTNKKTKRKKKEFQVFGPKRDLNPHPPTPEAYTMPPHYTSTTIFLESTGNFFLYLITSHPWRNDFNSSMTSGQRKICELEHGTVPSDISPPFSPSILPEIPVDFELSWTTISICFSLSTWHFSHQNKNVPTLYTSVECSLGYFF